MKLIFLDESGCSKNWTKNINEQPFFVLSSVMIDSQKYATASEELRKNVASLDVELKHPLGRGFEIKAKEIAKGKGFWKDNEEKRNSLRELMLSFPKKYDGVSFLVIVDKKKHLEKYKHPEKPHEMALKFMFERLQLKLKEFNETALSIYDQTKFLDDDLHFKSTDLIRDGSNVEYINFFGDHVSEKFNINRIMEFYLGKSDNSIGLQIADYFATFSYQYFKYGKPDDCGWWETIKSSLYEKNGTINGYGLKVFP